MDCIYEAQIIEKNLSLILDRPIHLHSPEVLLFNPAQFKKAYYHQAQKYHPDKAASNGLDPDSMAANFRCINEAYTHVLESWNSGTFKTLVIKRRYQAKTPSYTQEPLKTKTKPFSQAQAKKKPEPRTQKQAQPQAKAQGYTQPHSQKKPEAAKSWDTNSTKPLYHGSEIPRIELRFAQYLYYSRRIDWKTLINALSWQFQTRPKFGAIAIEFGFLTYEDILDILTNRMTAELFGDTAVRLGYLNSKERFLLIGRQRLFNLPIGTYFIQKGFLSEEEIPDILNEIRKHNFSVRAEKRYLYD